MSSQTADIQHLVSKTVAVERMYQTQKQQPDTDQQKFAAAIQQKSQEKTQQAQETTEAEQGRILKDRQDKLTLSSKQNKDDKKKKKENDSQESQDDAFETDVGHIVDIKV